MAVWVVDSIGAVFILDPITRRITEAPAPKRATSLTIGEGAVWVLSYDDRTVTRIDPKSLERVAVIPLDAKPTPAAAGAGGVWVELQVFGGRLVKIDPSTNIVVPVDLNALPKAAGRHWLWADQHRGFDRSALLRFDPSTGHADEIGDSPAWIRLTAVLRPPSSATWGAASPHDPYQRHADCGRRSGHHSGCATDVST